MALPNTSLQATSEHIISDRMPTSMPTAAVFKLQVVSQRHLALTEDHLNARFVRVIGKLPLQVSLLGRAVLL